MATPFLDWSHQISRRSTWSDRAVVLGGAAALALIIISKYAAHDHRLISSVDYSASGLSDTSGPKTDCSNVSSGIPSNESIDSITVSVKPMEYPMEIQTELYSRVMSFFGNGGFAQLRESFVIVSEAHHDCDGWHPAVPL